MIILCTKRRTDETVAYGNHRGGIGIALDFAVVDPNGKNERGAPLVTGIGEFTLTFLGEEVPQASAFVPGQRYRLVPA